jgi:hypothetical protein
VCVLVVSTFIMFSNVSGSMQLRGKKYMLVVKCCAPQGWECRSLQAAFQGQVDNGIGTEVCMWGYLS